jgi:hypothetical protein
MRVNMAAGTVVGINVHGIVSYSISVVISVVVVVIDHNIRWDLRGIENQSGD